MPLKPHRALLPLSCLYGAVVALRNRMYDCGWLRARRFPTPVISVGNLSAGGTGKTPHIEYLLRLLLPLGQVAVLSRGYRRQSHGYVRATEATPVEEIGDEPWQMKHKFPRAIVAVDADRCHGIELLEQNVGDLRAILLDDAFQHRRVKPGLSLLLIDSHRLPWDDRLLPAGYLREPLAGKRRADAVIFTKCPTGFTRAEADALKRRLQPEAAQQVYFTTLAYGRLQPLFPGEGAEQPLSALAGRTVVLLAGIAHPKPLAETLGQWAQVKLLAYDDHHDFSPADLQHLADECRQATNPVVVTTEKDAARLSRLRNDYPAALRAESYVLPVEVKFLFGDDKKFNEYITRYVQQHPRNHPLSPPAP